MCEERIFADAVRLRESPWAPPASLMYHELIAKGTIQEIEEEKSKAEWEGHRKSGAEMEPNANISEAP